MQYLGIDWSYRRAAWCALSERGTTVGEGVVPADEDGLARLVLELGRDVRAVVEMMSGAIWVRDQLTAAGWEVKVAHARKVRDVAPLACKTDKVDARVLAELCRRDLVPELWVPPLEDRELRERLRRRMHLVRMRASAMNRIFGLLTQWGLRLSLKRLRAPDAMALLEQRGVPEVWRRSIAEALAVIDLLDERITPIDQELGPLARADARVILLDTIPGVGELLGLTIASEIGDVARFGSPRKLIGYAGLAPKINQSGDRSRTGALSKGRLTHAALGRRGGRPPCLAAHQPLAPALQRHRGTRRQEPRQVRRRAQDPDRRLARPLAPATLHARRAATGPSCLGKLPLLSGRLTAPHGIEKPRQLPRTLCADPSAEREMSTPPTPGSTQPNQQPEGDLTRPTPSKRKEQSAGRCCVVADSGGRQLQSRAGGRSQVRPERAPATSRPTRPLSVAKRSRARQERGAHALAAALGSRAIRGAAHETWWLGTSVCPQHFGAYSCPGRNSSHSARVSRRPATLHACRTSEARRMSQRYARPFW
jgi:transposase